MQRLRSTWLALAGGGLLVVLSISAAFGADPTAAGQNRGQQVSAFVHELIFGSDPEAEEEPVLEEEEEQDPEDEPEEPDEESDEAESVTGAEHGACVSEVARDRTAIGGPNQNHGGAVSEAARDTCWDAAEEEDEAPIDEDATDEPTEESQTDKEQRKAEREAAKAERRAEREAAKAARENGNGNGNGRP